MSAAVITADRLAKRYRIGTREQRADTLASAAAAWLRRPLTNLVRLRALSRFRDGDDADVVWALRDVSFEVEPGATLAVIGRNGAGKSTLLKILSRITPPSSGRAVIRGRVASLLEVGTGFHQELTGRENVYLNGTILGMTKPEVNRKFDEIVAFAEVERFIDTPVKRYSSGMKMRLAFAVAAHLEPEILLIDEVLAVGDIAFQRKCLGKMGSVAREGRTVLFVSHNMAAIRKLCTSAILLEHGRITVRGATDDVVDAYLAAAAECGEAEVELPAGREGAPGRGLRLRFFDREGTPRSRFRLGEPWRVAFDFEVAERVPHVIAAIGIATVDAQPVVTWWSRPADLRPGTYRAEFQCDLPLAACELVCTAGLSSWEQPFYYVPDVGRVAISEAASGDQPVRASGAGLLTSTQRTDIQPLGEPALRTVSA
jgi:lipopolysaccharide transport system ATP-binding protein